MRSAITQKKGPPTAPGRRARAGEHGSAGPGEPGPGQRALDLGCGPRGVLDLLAARVGPTGRVVGVDADPAHVAMAHEFAARLGMRNVEVLTADARGTGLSSGSFDVVHARTVLVTVPEPAVVAAEMARLARPGGWVVSVEPDTEYMLCYPANAAFDRISTFFAPVFSRNGADPWIGRRVPELLRQAGLEDIGVRVTAQAYPAGHTRRTIRLDLLRSIRAQVLEMGLVSAEELDELDAAAAPTSRIPPPWPSTGCSSSRGDKGLVDPARSGPDPAKSPGAQQDHACWSGSFAPSTRRRGRLPPFQHAFPNQAGLPKEQRNEGSRSGCFFHPRRTPGRRDCCLQFRASAADSRMPTLQAVMVRHGSQDLMRLIDVPLIRSPGAARAENRRQIGRSNRPITGPTAAWHAHRSV